MSADIISAPAKVWEKSWIDTWAEKRFETFLIVIDIEWKILKSRVIKIFFDSQNLWNENSI